MDAGTGWLTTEQAARRAGVKPDTLRHYAARGLAPAPARFGRSLMWDAALLADWLATRPGRGTRTDLHPRA